MKIIFNKIISFNLKMINYHFIIKTIQIKKKKNSVNQKKIFRKKIMENKK